MRSKRTLRAVNSLQPHPSRDHSDTAEPIERVAERIGIPLSQLYHYGPYMAKVEGPPPASRGRLVLVTALTPTPAGEGKTTVAIGLTQGLSRLGQHAAVALREPSMGPVFGLKGGGTGAGRACLLPATDINLHFTGDGHAVSAATNLLAAVVGNHLQRGNELGIDPKQVEIKRVLDVNDRVLRHVITGLGGRAHGVPRETGFEITAAGEVMAILALAEDLADAKRRLGNIRVATGHTREPVYARDLKVSGAMTALLMRALQPNLVQTAEGQPAFVHAGPYANLAHGTSSVIATRTALGYADITVTEAGFGSDLGAEKFFNVVAAHTGLAPDAVVLVVTLRALRYHGGAETDTQADLGALERGLANLDQHLDIVAQHGYRPVVALNAFASDTRAEVERLAEHVGSHGLHFAVTEGYSAGGEGALELAEAVMNALDETPHLRPLYDLTLPLSNKIERIAIEIYGAGEVAYTRNAERALKRVIRQGGNERPVVIAKTPRSLSDDPRLRNRPQGFTATVTDLQYRSGAEFVVAYMGDVLTMPGLPATPNAEQIDVTPDGRITGLE
ncbi:MAG: formate--tetrahydrofolate ligase [Trueperaceae bacterium]|nr:MAG: formate--tetrahydrofolate ligase [Trueperaceae bacterium]